MSRFLRGFRARAVTVTFLALPLAAAPAAAQGQGDPDLKAVTAYTLTMPKYKQYLEASVNIANAVAKDTSVLPRLNAYGNKPMAEQIKVLDGIPVIRSAITAAGSTSRDYLLTQAALLQAGMVHAMTKDGKVPTEKMIADAGVNRANVEFYQKNEPEITRLAKEAEARSPVMPAKAESAEDGDEPAE